MYNKIDPRQISLHAFSSPSGHVTFAQTEAEVFCNLFPTLTGDFNIVGDFQVNSGEVLASHSTNFASGIGTLTVAGQDNNVSGLNSVIVGGSDGQISGARNAILNGNQGVIMGNDSVILGGYGGLITFNGAAVLGDGRVTTKTVPQGNSFLMDFESGVFINNSIFGNGDLHIADSGLISGDFNVLGEAFYQGAQIATRAHATGIVAATSGVLSGTIDVLSGFTTGVSGSLYDLIEATGLALLNRNDFVDIASTQTITGRKAFSSGFLVHGGQPISGTGDNVNHITLHSNTYGACSGTSIINTSKDGAFILLDSNDDGDYTSQDFSSFWDNSFVVGVGGETPDTTTVVGAVHPSGIGYFKNTIILDTPTFIPTAPTDPGYKGQLAWEGGGNGLAHLYLNTGDRWVRFSGVWW